ncbi:MAG: hypothetical protein ACK44W_10530 [Planctomycetota bacterium]
MTAILYVVMTCAAQEVPRVYPEGRAPVDARLGPLAVAAAYTAAGHLERVRSFSGTSEEALAEAIGELLR